MPSKEHEGKIEEIRREIESRSMDWKTKKQYSVWLPQENLFGLIDIVGFKKKTQNSPAEIDAYEIEEKSPTNQRFKNFEKLETLKKSFAPDVKVNTCQLNSNQDHKKVCPKNKFPTRNFKGVLR